ncbi:MAG TPA: hypothetical protein VN709_06420 [Terriglobales bacterium]|nr:hypothetical protein [Terriglobales bacterium]
MKPRQHFWVVASIIAATGWAMAQTAPAPRSQDIPAPTTAAAPATAHAPVGDSNLVPAQTPIELQLETHLSTRDNKYGDGFAARVVKSVYYQGREVIPSGSILEGHVLRVRDARPMVSDSELLLQPDLLSTPNGQRYTVSAEVIQGDPVGESKVDKEGVLREPRGVMTTDIHHAEIGAGSGMIGGALLAGGEGAVAGAGVGAAVAAGIWLARHRHLELNPGSKLTVRLDRPLELKVP